MFENFARIVLIYIPAIWWWLSLFYGMYLGSTGQAQ